MPTPSTKPCMKCKEKPAVVVVRGRDPLCGECAYATALSKVRQALRLKIGIVAEDKIMVCLSGGFSSRAMLQLLQDCRSADKDNPGRSKRPFELVVAHVDQGAACGLDQAAGDEISQRVRQSVEGCVPPADYMCLHIEDVFDLEGGGADRGGGEAMSREERREKLNGLIQSVPARGKRVIMFFVSCLKEKGEGVRGAGGAFRIQAADGLMLQAIPDTTGREDLVRSMREALLLSAARRRGVTRLARGDSISRLASRVIACAAKGDGYAMPSTLHFLDARFGAGQPVWISPVRDLAAKDLALVAHLHRLETVATPPVPPARSQASINGLAERFIAGLQLGMPSTVHAVLGTACKLQAFPWNRQVQQSPISLSDLCGICSAPLDASHPRVGSQMERACRSCQQQLWGRMSSATANLPSQTGSVVIPEMFVQCRRPDIKNSFHSTENGDVTNGIQSGTPVSQPRTTDWMEAQLSDCLL